MSFKDIDLIVSRPRLMAHAFKLCKNPAKAEDLVQDTMMRAIANRNSFKEGTNFSAWLHTILRNQFYDGLRRSKREVADPTGSFIESLVQIPDQIDYIDTKKCFSMMQKLPKEQQEALKLVAIEGHSYEEAGEIIKVPTGTVKSRVSRARKALMEIFQYEPNTDNISIGIIAKNELERSDYRR